MSFFPGVPRSLARPLLLGICGRLAAFLPRFPVLLSVLRPAGFWPGVFRLAFGAAAIGWVLRVRLPGPFWAVLTFLFGGIFALQIT